MPSINSHTSTVPGRTWYTSANNVVASRGYSQAILAFIARVSISGTYASCALSALASDANTSVSSTIVLIRGLIPTGSRANIN